MGHESFFEQARRIRASGERIVRAAAVSRDVWLEAARNLCRRMPDPF
jgi:hypothetical protein